MKRFVSTRSALIAAPLAFAVACGGSQGPGPQAGPQDDPSTSFRTQMPKPGPAPELQVPVPTRKKLPNGLTLYMVHQPDLPLVRVSVVVRGGAAADPDNKAGLAGFLAETLKAGTKNRTDEQIAREVESLGSSLEVSANQEYIALAFSALTPHTNGVLNVLADVLLNPAFAPEEIERARRKRLSALAQALDDPGRLAGRVFRRAVYGDHPYGHDVLGYGEAIESITAEDLKAYYEAYFRPDNAAVIVVGDLDEAAAEAAIVEQLGSWAGSGPAVEPPPSATASPGRLVVVNRPNAPQSQLRIGHLSLRRDHPDYFPVLMMNAVLGGLFNSRIMMNLREDKGYTYGARSTFNFARSDGYFVAYSAVRSDVTGPAISEVVKEIDEIRNADVSTEELELAKNRYSLSLPGYFQDVYSVAQTVTNIHLYDLPLDYYRQVPEKLRAVTVADVRRVAQEHLHPDRMQFVVVGDKSIIEDSLRQLGELVPGELRAPELPPQTEVWETPGGYGSATKKPGAAAGTP